MEHSVPGSHPVETALEKPVFGTQVGLLYPRLQFLIIVIICIILFFDEKLQGKK